MVEIILAKGLLKNNGCSHSCKKNKCPPLHEKNLEEFSRGDLANMIYIMLMSPFSKNESCIPGVNYALQECIIFFIQQCDDGGIISNSAIPFFQV
jgi:hypothetical protein